MSSTLVRAGYVLAGLVCVAFAVNGVVLLYALDGWSLLTGGLLLEGGVVGGAAVLRSALRRQTKT